MPELPTALRVTDTDHSAGSSPPEPTGGPAWVEVAAGRDGRSLREAGLVLASAAIEHATDSQADGWRILVPLGSAERALQELAAYRAENRGWPERHPPPRSLSDGAVGAGTYVFVIVLLHVFASYGALGIDWQSIGMMHAERVRAGEVERLVTALMLHGDLTHLLSNIVFGVSFGVLTAHALGGGLTWFLALVAGSLGNLANAFIQSPHHRSLGASTSVFAILGTLAAYEWARRSGLRQAAFRRVAPILAAAVLLGWLGVGDVDSVRRVDVWAHVLGSAFGAVLGVIAARANLPLRLPAAAQQGLAAATLLLAAGAWTIALARS